MSRRIITDGPLHRDSLPDVGFLNNPRIWESSDEGVGVGAAADPGFSESCPGEEEFATASLTWVGRSRLGPSGLFQSFNPTNTKDIPQTITAKIMSEVRYIFRIFFIINHPISYVFPKIYLSLANFNPHLKKLTSHKVSIHKEESQLPDHLTGHWSGFTCRLHLLRQLLK